MSSPLSQWAAVLFALACACVGAFQLALVLGAPWGELTLGGRWRGRLPPRVRFIPLLSALALAFFAAVILARAGFTLPWPLPPLLPYAGPLAWVVVGYCLLGALANAATPSRRERRLWLPVVLVMLVTSFAVAVS